MNNVTEIYRKLNAAKSKAPGSFLNKKATKEMIKEMNLKYEKVEDEYYFDDKLTEEYSSFVNPEDEVEDTVVTIETSSLKEFNELVKIIGENNTEDYVNKLFSWFIINDNFYSLQTKLNDNPLKYAIDNFDIIIAAYLHMIKCHCMLNHNKVNRGEIRNLCRDIKKSFSQVWVSQYNNPKVFRKDNKLYSLTRTNQIQETILP